MIYYLCTKFIIEHKGEKMEKKEEFNVQKTYGKLATISRNEFIQSYNVNVNGRAFSKPNWLKSQQIWRKSNFK